METEINSNEKAENITDVGENSAILNTNPKVISSFIETHKNMRMDLFYDKAENNMSRLKGLVEVFHSRGERCFISGVITQSDVDIEVVPSSPDNLRVVGDKNFETYVARYDMATMIPIMISEIPWGRFYSVMCPPWLDKAQRSEAVSKAQHIQFYE